MGASFAPAVAQACAMAVVRQTLNRARERGIDPDTIHGGVWIDNFYFFAEEEETAVTLRQIFQDVVAECRVTLKELSEVSCSLQLLGCEINFRDKTVGPGAGLQETLRTVADAQIQESTAAVEWLRKAGTIFFPNYVYGHRPLALTPNFFESIQRACLLGLSNSWQAEVPLDEAAWLELKVLANELLTQTKMHDIAPQPNTLLWVDASTTHLGALVQQGMKDLAEHSWQHQCTHREIFYAELLAAVKGEGLTTEPHVTITDNSAAAAAMRKGHTSTRQGNSILRHWLMTTRATHIAWVPTDWQRADALTRPQQDIIDKGPWVPMATPVAWKIGGG